MLVIIASAAVTGAWLLCCLCIQHLQPQAAARCWQAVPHMWGPSMSSFRCTRAPPEAACLETKQACGICLDPEEQDTQDACCYCKTGSLPCFCRSPPAKAACTPAQHHARPAGAAAPSCGPLTAEMQYTAVGTPLTHLLVILLIHHIFEQHRYERLQVGLQQLRAQPRLTEGAPELARLQGQVRIPILQGII